MRISREKIEHCAVEAGRRTIHFGEAAGRRIRRFSRRTWIIIVIVAVVVAGGLYWLLKPAPPQPVYPIVEVEPVQTSDMEIYGDYVGRIRAQQFVEIRARVEGFLEKMLFEGYIRQEESASVHHRPQTLPRPREQGPRPAQQGQGSGAEGRT